jgi:hypothetical protein
MREWVPVGFAESQETYHNAKVGDVGQTGTVCSPQTGTVCSP